MLYESQGIRDQLVYDGLSYEGCHLLLMLTGLRMSSPVLLILV